MVATITPTTHSVNIWSIIFAILFLKNILCNHISRHIDINADAICWVNVSILLIYLNVLAIILEMFLRLLTFWWFVCNDGWFAPHIPKRSCYYFSFRCIHCGCIMLTMVVLMLLRLVFFNFFFPVSANGIRV